MKSVLMTVFAAIVLSSASVAGDWWEKVTLKGDLRYRHEMLDTDQSAARNRQRIRARVGFKVDVSDYTKFGVQFATGSSDPVSTNQTLDDGFSSKSVVLDRAYFEASHHKLPGLKLTGGKFGNPFFKPGSSELLWDSDLNPEGGVADYTREFTQGSVTLLGAGFWIDESSSSDDAYLTAGQGVVRLNLNEKKSSLAFGAGYFYYGNARGYTLFYDHEDAFGNSTVTVGEGDDAYKTYANGYELVELFAEVTNHVNGIPVTVMGDFVTNTAADSLNTGWLAGLRVGKTKKPGSWAFRYIYRELEKDAVVGIFTDSDFRGGGTDARGHEIGGSIMLADKTSFDVSYFMNEIGLTEKENDFTRLQIDLQLKF